MRVAPALPALKTPQPWPVSTGLPGLSVEKTGKQKPPDRRPSLQRRGGGRQEAGDWGGGREGGVAAAPEHKNNEARGAMGPSRLVPELLSDLDRCHSWAPGEEPPPLCCSTTPPTPCHLPQARLMEVQAGSSHRKPPHQVGAGRPECS